MIELFELFNKINNLHSRNQTESQSRQSRQLSRRPRNYSIDHLGSKVLIFKDNSINSAISGDRLGMKLVHHRNREFPRSPERVRTDAIRLDKGFNKRTDLFLECLALPSSSTGGGFLL